MSSAPAAANLALEKVEPARPPTVFFCLLPPYVIRRDDFSRMLSMFISLNSLAALSSSSLNTSYAPRFSSVSTSFASRCLPRPLPAAPLPCAIIASSSPSFSEARWNMACSYVLRVTRRYTCTFCDCPMRCTRACACRSFCGFQSESKMMTVSADTRLMPRPPARVDSSMQKAGESGLLNRSMAACRSRPRMWPSRRSNWYRRLRRKCSSTSSMRTIWLKMSTRWPPACSFGSSLSRSTSLPEVVTRMLAISSCVVASFSSWSAMPLIRYGWLQHLRSSMTTFISDGAFLVDVPAISTRVFFS
mmetsp:Transcript_16562/g.57897  ORF Transcript_16562/g.57897 Transcript_16562/m.57897 type:complete len:303 (+) Transcript_16562:375-1283(+)